METSQKIFAALFAEWQYASLAMLTGKPPARPLEQLTPMAAPSAEKQQWEAEGGSVEASIQPAGSKPGPKIPH